MFEWSAASTLMFIGPAQGDIHIKTGRNGMFLPLTSPWSSSLSLLLTLFMSFSTPVSLFLILSAAWSSVDGLNLPFERRAPRGGSMTSPRSGSRYHFGGNTDKEASPIGNVKNIRVSPHFPILYLSPCSRWMQYTSNITINGVEVHVALDTGSTDLWCVSCRF